MKKEKKRKNKEKENEDYPVRSVIFFVYPQLNYCGYFRPRNHLLSFRPLPRAFTFLFLRCFRLFSFLPFYIECIALS